MLVFIPSSDPTILKSVGCIYQNAWNKTTSILDIIRKTNKIFIPYIHTNEDITNYEKNPEDIHKYSKIAIDFPINSMILIPNGKKGLLVRITSPVYSGNIDYLCISCSPRKCGHTFVSHCEICKDSIKEVFDSSNMNKIHNNLKNNNIIEPFYALYRHVEIIGDVDFNGIHPLKLISTAFVSIQIQFWAIVLKSSLKPRLIIDTTAIDRLKEEYSPRSSDEISIPVTPIQKDKSSPLLPLGLSKKWFSALF